MKDTIKMVVSHFFIISVSVMTVIGVANLFIADRFAGYGIEFPFIILLVGATSALPSFLFYFRTEPTKKQFILRMILHFICIEAVVLGEGRLLGWYDGITEMLLIAVMVVVVYVIVTLITMYSESKTERGINEALNRLNNEE